MHEKRKEYLLGRVRKCAGLVVRGILTGREFVNAVFDEFANAERVYPEVVPEVYAAIPDATRAIFADAIRDAVRPEFRNHAFYIGVQLDQDAPLRTARIQAWAREFINFLEKVDASRSC